jgi:hypothetical protein
MALVAEDGAMTREVFVSHAAADAEFVRRLAADLQRFDLRVVRANDVVQPGAPVREAIADELRKADAVIIVLSKAAAESKWVLFEGAVATAANKRVIPILIDEGVELPPFLHNISALKLVGHDWERYVPVLAQGILEPHKAAVERNRKIELALAELNAERAALEASIKSAELQREIRSSTIVQALAVGLSVVSVLGVGLVTVSVEQPSYLKYVLPIVALIAGFLGGFLRGRNAGKRESARHADGEVAP